MPEPEPLGHVAILQPGGDHEYCSWRLFISNVEHKPDLLLEVSGLRHGSMRQAYDDCGGTSDRRPDLQIPILPREQLPLVQPSLYPPLSQPPVQATDVWLVLG